MSKGKQMDIEEFIPNPPFVRNPYNYDTMAASDESGLKCKDPSLTSQSFKDECDINVIIDRYVRSGEPLPLPDIRDYGDFTGALDYHSSVNQILAAQASFMALPAKVRSRFNNDPGQLLEFISDADNIEEARKLGILAPEEPLSTGGDRAPDSAGAPPVGKGGLRPLSSKKGVSRPAEGDEGDD